MRIFADFHHAGMARGIMLLFVDRLGHEVWFPDAGFACWAMDYVNTPGVWNHKSRGLAERCGGIPQTMLDAAGEYPYICSQEQFFATEWDAVLITRTESQPIFDALIAGHPRGGTIKRIVLHGNEGGGYDYQMLRNLMSSDYSTYMTAPSGVHKIHYSQELGRHYHTEYVPITEKSLKRVHSYMQFLRLYQRPTTYDSDIALMRGCPHCRASDGKPLIWEPAFELWGKCVDRCIGVEFHGYGHGSPEGLMPESEMPGAYHNAALTWHMKHCEGYGFSLLQSIACGRLVIVPKRFYRYRTAGQYLINQKTCFEVEWNAAAIGALVKWYTSDLDRANEFAAACWQAGKGLFNWEFEAHRVKRFLEELK